MSAYEMALEHDIAQEIEKAAEYYEISIRESEATLDAYINLACLYWQATDFGFNAALNLPADFIKIAGSRMYAVLESAEKIFGHHSELTFWRMYFDFTSVGEPPFPEKALELAQQSDDTLVPYMHVYDQTRDEKYRIQVEQLLEEANSTPTTKNRYIASILNSSSLNE